MCTWKNVLAKFVTFIVLLVPVVLVDASPLAWDGAPSYSGSNGAVDGGGVSGGGGLNLIKILSHNAAPAGDAQSGASYGGTGGDRFTNGGAGGSVKAKKGSGAPSGSGGGAAYSGASGSAAGGDAHTDPQLSVLELLSDNAAPGGTSKSGPAIGGNAGNIF